MTLNGLISLAKYTLKTPRAAAEHIIAQQLPRDVLWTALAFVAAINTIILQMLIWLSPPATQAQFPSYFNAPLAVYVLFAGIMVVYIHAVYWAALALGGKGQLFDILALLVWLQVLRTVAQVVILAATLIAPALAGLLSLAVFAVAFWVLLHFVTQAMALPSLGHALMALLLAVVGLVMGLGILLALLGLLAQGAISNV